MARGPGADGLQAVVHRQPELVAHPVMIAPDHLGRVARQRPAVEDRAVADLVPVHQFGIGTQGACDETSATCAKMRRAARGLARSSLSSACRVNWSGMVTQLNGSPIAQIGGVVDGVEAEERPFGPGKTCAGLIATVRRPASWAKWNSVRRGLASRAR
jgi:hypothetical protein